MVVDPTIIVATIGAVALVSQTWLGTRHSREANIHAKAAKDTAAEVALIGAQTHAIVQGNGHGTVMAVVERTEAKVDAALSWLGKHEAHHAIMHAMTEQAATSASAAAELAALPTTK